MTLWYVQVGSLVYARMIVANKDMEPEISCMTGSGKAEGFGPLNGGYMIKTSTGLARQCVPESTFSSIMETYSLFLCYVLQ
jgi:exosome complex component RRP40